MSVTTVPTNPAAGGANMSVDTITGSNPLASTQIVKLAVGAAGVQNLISSTNPVPALLTAGSAIAGNVGIDQTTPGTTNGVQVNAALPAGTNTIGVVGVAAQAAGGATSTHLVTANSTNATSLKASAGTVYGIAAYNENAAPQFLKLYNKASAPTVGTDTPVATFIIPGNTAGAGLNFAFAPGIAFSTGIAFAVTNALADNDTTSAPGGDCVVNIFYS